MKLLYRYWKSKRRINGLEKRCYELFCIEDELRNKIRHYEACELEQQEFVIDTKKKYYDLSIKHDDLIKRLNENNN